MSELLLKGATMTNAHCSDCGDPIFRYDGQEFCASCQKPVDRSDEEEADDATGDGDADTPASVEVASPSDDARVQFGGEDTGSEAAEADESDGAEPDAPSASEIEDAVGGEEGSASTGTAPATQPPAADAATAIESARADLAATLQRFARAARESESPAAAKAHLEATREAAETLDELD